MRQGEELLDTVYRTVRCTYLSDLREEPYLEAAIGYLSGVEPEDYPLYQWQEGKGLVKTASLLHVEKLERAGIEL